MNHRFSELVDVPRVRVLTNLFYEFTGIPSFVRDLDGSVLVDSGGSDVCMGFYRANPETRARCEESLSAVHRRLESGENHVISQCRNGLIEAAAPICVRGEPVGSVVAGRFVMKPPEPAFFRQQAQLFGFEETAYMTAVARLPVVAEAKVPVLLDYLSQLAGMLGEAGHAPAGLNDPGSPPAGFDPALRSAACEGQRGGKYLHEAQKAEILETFAAGIAHDFNNVLAAVVGFAEIAMGRAPDGPLTRPLQRIFDAGAKGRDMIKQLLAIARRSELQKQNVKAGEVMEEAIGLLRSSLPPAVSVRLDVREEAGLLAADGAQIRQLFFNLLSNAARSMIGREGFIDVKLSGVDIAPGALPPHPRLEPGSYLAVAVTDSGGGVGEDERERIFDPYFSSQKQGRGAGLGLAAARSIAESHSGAITVGSIADSGTTFTVYLPKTIP